MNGNGFKLSAALALALIVPAQAPAQESPLTALDYIAIQQLVNRVNFALDYCTNGGEDFADLFVDGGRYVIDGGDGKPTDGGGFNPGAVFNGPATTIIR